MKFKLIKTYGIAICDKSKTIDAVTDISTSRYRTKKLCRECNKLKLSPEHLRDVIEDFISV